MPPQIPTNAKQFLNVFLKQNNESNTSKSISRNNDFIFEDGNGDANSNDAIKDAIKTIDVIKKHGFSKKTASKIVKFNSKLRSDLKINPKDYMILAPLIMDPMNSISPKIYCEKFGLTGDFVYPIYKKFLEFYNRDLIGINPERQDIEVKASGYLKNYVLSKKIELPKKAIREIIKDMDSIANLCVSEIGDFMADLAINSIVTLIDKYKHEHKLCKYLSENICYFTNKNEFSNELRLVFLYIFGEMVLEDDEVTIESGFIRILEDALPLVSVGIHALFDDDNFLFKNKIIDRCLDDSGKTDKYSICFHDDFVNEYLKEFVIDKTYEFEIKPKDVIKKELFFTEKNEKQTNEIIDLFGKTYFKKIKKRMDANGMRKGFICLFSGAPGLGKCLDGSEKINLMMEEHLIEEFEAFVQSQK